MQKIFDTHVHYNLDPLWTDWKTEWTQAQKLGLRRSLIAGADFENSRRALEIAQNEPYLYASLGLHPTAFLEEESSQTNQKTQSLAEQKTQILTIAAEQINMMKDWSQLHQQVVAVGEIGLEYFRLHERDDFAVIREIEHEILNWQLDWAQTVDKTVIFHLRDEKETTYEEILAILRQRKIATPIIMHCVSGSPDFIQTVLNEFDAYVSFAGNVTYKNAQNLRDLVPLVPAEKLLIETDAPFLPPASHRGQLCHPSYIVETAAFMQRQFGVDLDQVFANSLTVFSLKN